MSVKPQDQRHSSGEGNPQQPLLRVINADATPEEIAAIVAVFAVLGYNTPPPTRKVSEWSAHHRKLRTPSHAGPGGWRSSGLPR